MHVEREGIPGIRTGDLKMRLKVIFASVILFCSAGISFADEIYLKNDKTIEGNIETDGTGSRKTDNNEVAVWLTERNAAEYIAKGELNKIEEVYREGLKKFPNNALLWAALAGNTLDQGRFDEAIEYCNRSLSFNPCSAEAYFAWGLVFAKKGEEDKAIQKFQEAIKCDPSFNVAYYDLGLSYISKQRYSEGIDMLVKATQLDKKGDMEKKIENALNTTIQKASPDRMIIQKESPPKPWILLPPFEISQKKISESLLLEYQTKLQLKGQPDFLYYMNMGGINYYYRGDFDKGLEDTKMALSMLLSNKDLPEEEKQKTTNYIYRLLGDIYLHTFEFELAQKSYQEALKFNSKDTNSLCGVGIVYTVKEDFDKARETYGKVLDLEPNSSFAQEALKRLENK